MRVYVETSVISYLTAKPSQHLRASADQQSTHEFWDQLERFEVFVSELVIQECSAGDPVAASRRLEVIGSIPILALNDDVDRLTENLLKAAALPLKAADDAVHVALAAVHGMDFLATWNCKHIANPSTRKKIERICVEAGYSPPVLCTPEELLEADDA